ncbi:MAG: MOSC N-terminal beta barrel domain-containing protein [Actinomycetota bacterium]|jgi:uncharacterized protein
MSNGTAVPVGRVAELWRYPVKSTLGEQLEAVDVSAAGFGGDRGFGIIDAATGLVASAKRPQRWARLLQLQSELVSPGVVQVRLPDGRRVVSTDADSHAVLSAFLGRDVELQEKAGEGAALERSDPDEVLAAGQDADVAFTMLEIAAGSPPGTFFDFSPLQLVTTAALRRVGASHPAGRVDAARYRPNFVIDTVAALEGFVENDWVGRRLRIGPEVVIDVLVPSPRCAIPTLRHGDLPPDPDALRTVREHNFVPVPIEGFGSATCLGAHAAVVARGRVAVGDEVVLVG